MEQCEVKMLENVFYEKSEKIVNLAKALPKMLGDIKNTANSKSGYDYKYAPLNQILEESRPVLAKSDFSITQLVGTKGINITIKTILMHSSGEYIMSEMELPPTEIKGTVQIQKMGASITYARRYMLTAILGIAGEEDTDGVAPTHPKKPKPVPPKREAPEPSNVQKTSGIKPPKAVTDVPAQVESGINIIDKLLAESSDRLPKEELDSIISSYDEVRKLENSPNKVQQLRDFFVFVKQTLKDLEE